MAVSRPAQCLTGRVFVIAISVSAARACTPYSLRQLAWTHWARCHADALINCIRLLIVSCLNPPCPCSCASNPHFYLETTQPDTMVVVSLVQAEPDRNALPAIGFKVGVWRCGRCV